MMKQCIITAIFLPIYLFAQDTSSVYDQKLNQLRKHLGIIENAEFNSEVYNTLVERLDSLGIKDEQLQDGFEWGGGKAGFEEYIKNNIDSLIVKFKMVILNPDTLKSLAEIDSSKILKVIKPDTVSLKTVKDLTAKILPKEEIKIIKQENTKKSSLSGLRLSGNLGKALLKGVSLSSHSSYVEPSFFIRFPYGINIGSFLTSIGYESAKYSFESSIDTVGRYFGSSSGLL